MRLLDSVVMLFVFAYLAHALPHAPRLELEARRDGAVFKKLSKRNPQLVWRGGLPWGSHQFWRHLPVDLTCLDLKPAWDSRIKYQEDDDHDYETKFREQIAYINVFTPPDQDAAESHIKHTRDERIYMHDKIEAEKLKALEQNTGNPPIYERDMEVAFGSVQDKEGHIKFIHVIRPNTPKVLLPLCVQNWEITAWGPD